MATEIKRGYLTRLKGGVAGRLAAKRKWVKLVHYSGQHEVRLEIYATEKAARDGELAKEGVNLSDAKLAIRTTKHKYTFIIQLENLDGDSEALTFSSDSDTDADDWVDAINRLLMQNHSHGRWSAPTQMPAPQQPMMPRSVNGQVTNFGDGKFLVFPTVLHEKLNCQAGDMAVMRISTDRISLLTEAEVLLVDWGLSALRRYGNTNEYFQFEAGRRTTTGEGVFTFMTKDGQSIYDLVHRFTQEMVARNRSATNSLNRNSSTNGHSAVNPTNSLPPQSSLPVSAGDRNSVSSQSSPRSSRLSCSSSSGGVVGGVQRGSLATTPENAYQGLQTATRTETSQYQTTTVNQPNSADAPPPYMDVVAADIAAGGSASQYQPLQSGARQGATNPAPAAGQARRAYQAVPAHAPNQYQPVSLPEQQGAYQPVMPQSPNTYEPVTTPPPPAQTTPSTAGAYQPIAIQAQPQYEGVTPRPQPQGQPQGTYETATPARQSDYQALRN